MGNEGKQKKVLFVDDDPRLIEGLKRLLRPSRSSWQMEFLTDGCEALKYIEHNNVDIVISDMRMPDVDGVTLLRAVRDYHPEAARFVLSGEASEDKAFQAARFAHQFLAKPCGAQDLKARVEKACQLGDLLPDNESRALVASWMALPSPTCMFDQIVNLLSHDAPSITAIAEVCIRDAAIAAKLLQLVNSSFFGAGRIVDDVTRAVQLLGIDTLRNLFGESDAFVPPANDKEEERIAAIARANQAIAKGARQVVAMLGGSESDAAQAYTAGLLCNVASLGLGTAEISRETTQQMSCYLLSLWGLPEQIIIPPRRDSFEHGSLVATAVAGAQWAFRYSKGEEDANPAANINNSLSRPHLSEVVREVEYWYARPIC